MSNLINCQDVSKSFGAQKLFQQINLIVHSGDRIGLIGPNGSGKSTFLKIICGLEDADEGKITSRKHVRTSYLAQSDQFDEEESIETNLLQSLDTENIDEIEKYNRVQSLLSLAEFDDIAKPVHLLSGGWRKRLAICCALVTLPDVLIMDEPTNHLDIEGIIWLTKMLSSKQFNNPESYIVVSHDRHFLENSCNKIVELSASYPDGSLQVSGSYSEFLNEREKFLSHHEDYEERLANKVRREDEWLSRGPKARATKAKYRIDDAHRLKNELQAVKKRNRAGGAVEIGFDATRRKTKKLLEAAGITKSFSDNILFDNLDLVLSPGTRLGLLGRNGCGKSTLMKLLEYAGSKDGLRPDRGHISIADNVKIVSFDQKRKNIDPNITLRRALAPDGDSVVYRDRSIHVVSWAKKFLFKINQLETPVAQLSGGEQARILIANLMRQPADILLLDEPTNDLDIPSLDVLEESLKEFPGALVLVTHDRYILDNVCDNILGFDGKGGVQYYADYRQWLRYIADSDKSVSKNDKPPEKKSVKTKSSKKSGRLSYMDQREYDQMEDIIMELEAEHEALQEKMAKPEVVADSGKLAKCWEKSEEVQEKLDSLYSRWEELEKIIN